MMERIPTYDSKCFDLAVLFLQDEPPLDTPGNRKMLGGVIQLAIEDWLAVARNPTGMGE